ncbi:hypothetical protein BDM02DRAFT_3187952 [Thelephora ganbajun]|uniref:Uncharacterized protein n=1 Tax=Thelephora ganbajun TaxID=370292 RepID=A0ACB6ZCN5_THEGA|nr:hypothetical protein BDM02DRAFT_3187952 [Thelephora ganbajun]
MDHPTTDSEVVSELLGLADTLKHDIHEQEAKEFAMFRARHKGDFEALRVLYPQFIEAENYAAALLCLDLTFIPTLPPHGVAIVDAESELSFHLAYFELLDRLRREDRLDSGSMRQKVFAFQPREDDRFFIPANSFLRAVFIPKPDIAQEKGGCVVTHEELRHTLDREIPEYIYLRAKQQHNTYRRRLGAAPCLMMVARGECPKPDCQFQHIRPERITASWFNARIRSVLMEIRILNLAGFHPKGVIVHWIGILYSTLHPPLPKLGSIATLDLGNTPESTEGIRILREWIWQACDKLLFSTSASPFEYIETFIPEFMPVCTMAYDFDLERAEGYVPRTRMYRYEKWPLCLTRPGLRMERHFIVRDFVLFLQGGPHHSLILGALYLRQILVNRIPVDIGPFCDAVERLCGLHILAYRFMTGRGTLHGVTLPRSWFIGLFRSLPPLGKHTSHIPHFVNDTIELLRRIDLQREHYNPQIFDNQQFKHNGSRLIPLYASVYIARICFCLCLLGYNINDNQLRSKVLKAIHCLWRPERVNGVYRQYAEASDWRGLVNVFTKSLSDSTLDEMILLLYSKAPKPQGWVSRYIRTVMYENIKEIPDRLRQKAADCADARELVNPPPSFPTSEGRQVEPDNDEGQQNHDTLPEEDVLNPSDGEPPVDNGSQGETSTSPEEIQAALTIEAAYYRVIKRRKEVPKGIDATRARLWSLLHDRASSMEWPRHKRYKLLMQGPLVHVLVCLGSIKMCADQINRDAKKQLQGDDHRRLEELIERSDRSSDLQRATVELQTKLGHSSPLHEDRSVLKLKAAVLEVERLIDRLSEFPGSAAIKTKERIKEDWKLGWDSIVKEGVKQILDISLFDVEALDSSGGLKTALRSVENACFQADPVIAGMVMTLSSRSHVLEYIFSALDEKAYEKLSSWIISEFPKPTTPNMTDTLSMRLLRRLSSSLLFAEYPSAADAPSDLRVFWRKVELSFEFLQDLEINVRGSRTAKATSPVSRKKGKTVAGGSRDDSFDFDSLGINGPTTDTGVREGCARVLSELQSILEYYLLVLRQPLVSEVFKSSYMKVYLAKENTAEERASSPEAEIMIAAPDRPAGPAFPMIQPMKASLYFEGIEGFGGWAILLSTRALKDLRDVKRSDGAMFRIVMKKIKQLSQGHFSPDNQKRLTGLVTKLPIYEAKMTNDTRLVYHIDCIPDQDRERQAIRVFGVFTHAQLDHGGFWDTLSQQLQHGGAHYVERCTFRNKPISPGDNVILPAVFPPLQIQDTPPVDPLIKVSEEDIRTIHSMHILEKFVTFSQALLNSILIDKEVSHVFQVSAQEQEIIEHSSSCYVIGRSGTGKTTTMLFKMLGVERTWQQYPDMGPKPRQVFVTQSKVLATKVEEYFAQLMGSLEAAADSRDRLRMMVKEANQRARLMDQDDDKNWRSDLPDKFSELSEEHFPLFITYDRLCTMLENDIKGGNDNYCFVVPKTPVIEDMTVSPRSPTSPTKSRFRERSRSILSSDYIQQFRRNFVSYGEFRASYWAHLPQTFTRVLDPALVFGEIMGVIKGSEEAVGTQQMCLDRETYRSLSCRTQGTFAHKRDEIYDLFMAYTKLRDQRQDYDTADRSHYILKALRDVGLKGRKVDLLYIDEVQDNLLVDTLILRTLCNNQRGLFWAGDTAQTIAVGSSFRFTELKAFQHRIEKQLSQEPGLAPAEPRTFELVVNYRSHGGIVSCARSIIELITHYWPHSIDPLKPERALIDGARPTFYSDQGDVAFEKSLFRTGGGGPVEFGAKQCILVRNDITKEKLQERLGKSIIMTLYDSKGLEFNDVLLYNFFEDSTATLSQWRLVLNDVEQKDHDYGVPVFDETRHASICSELKFLYVAITRAKKNLWIMDSSETAEPMKAYWKSRSQIKISSTTSEIASLAASSTTEEWIRTGEYMFFSKRYAQASIAFQRAKRPREAAVCDAYLLREKARSHPSTAGAPREKVFIEAAMAFNACAQVAPLKLEDERQAYYRNAGECFSEGRKWDEAGKNYVKAEEYTSAARAYRKGGHFDEMVEVLRLYGNSIDSEVVRHLTQVARMFYFKAGGISNCEKGIQLFSSDDQALVFLEDYDLDEARATVFQSRGKALEAAEAHAKDGRVLEAVEVLLERAAPSTKESRMAVRYVLAGLWKRMSFGVGFRKSDTSTTSLLQISFRLDSSAMTDDEVDELSMFKSIAACNQEASVNHDATDNADPDFVHLRRLAFRFLRRDNKTAALMCLDHVFSRAPSLHKATSMETESLLSTYFTYVWLLDRFWRDSQLSEGSNCQKIFAFEVQQKDHYLVPRDTFIHGKVSAARGTLNDPPPEYICSHEELGRVISSAILGHIRTRVEMQERACRGTRGFSPCLNTLTGRNCSNERCQFQHISPNEITLDWFHARLRFLFLEFKILRLAQLFDKGVMQYWLQMFYSALCPPIRKLGSLNNLDLRRIPEGEQVMYIIQEWTWYACKDLKMGSPPPSLEYNDHFIPDFMATCTLAYDLDFTNAVVYVPEMRVFHLKKRPSCLIRDGGYSIVYDFVTFLQYKSRQSLRAGCDFMRHVLSSQLRLDLSAFCDLAERLCALFIVEYCVQHKGNITNVTLPKSWLIHISRAFSATGKYTREMKPFLYTCVELMRRIDLSGEGVGEHLRASSARLNPFTSTVYVARMCSCLSLLGYNINDKQLKSDIVVAIQQFRKEDWRTTPALYRDYAWARDWNDLIKAFRNSFTDSPMDELILLLYSKSSRPYGWTSSFARPVIYDRLEDVISGIAFQTSKRIDGPPMPLPSQSSTAATENQVDNNHDGEREREGAPHESVVEGDEEDLPEQESHGIQTPELQAKIDAARKIQAVCIRYLKKAVPTGIHATRTRFWNQLQTRTAGMVWSHPSRYKLILRGPLVHVLVCLDVIGAATDSAKREVKKQSKAAHHEELEEVMESQARYRGLLKAVISLQKKLGPSSDFHERRDLLALKAAVLEVQEVIERAAGDLSFIAAMKEIDQDWEHGRKGILKEAVHRKIQKPKLVIDPEDYLYL